MFGSMRAAPPAATAARRLDRRPSNEQRDLIARPALEWQIHFRARLIAEVRAADVADYTDDLRRAIVRLDETPDALSFGKKRRWIASLMITTGLLCGVSVSSNSRPARRGKQDVERSRRT